MVLIFLFVGVGFCGRCFSQATVLRDVCFFIVGYLIAAYRVTGGLSLVSDEPDELEEEGGAAAFKLPDE